MLYNFYQALFKEKLSISEEFIQSFLDKASLTKPSKNQTLKCESAITKKEHLKALTSMDNDNSPGSDGITNKFYTKFWDIERGTRQEDPISAYLFSIALAVAFSFLTLKAYSFSFLYFA